MFFRREVKYLGAEATRLLLEGEKYMEEQYKNMYTKPTKRPQRRFWHLWGPLIIKLGITYLVSFAFTLILFVVYCKSKGIVTMDAMQAYMSSQAGAQSTYTAMLNESVKYLVIVDGIATALTIPIMLFMFHKDRVKEKAVGVVQPEKAKAWKYFAIIGIAAALCVGLNCLIIMSGLSPQDETYQETMTIMYSAPMMVQVICLGVLAPICEELVFRGLMFKRLRAQTSFVLAALYSTIVFAVIHGNMVQMVYAFVMGMVFAYAYEKYGSVKAPILAHITANMVSLICTEADSFGWMLEDSLRIKLVTIACAAIASTMYVLIQRMNEPTEHIENEEGSTAV